MPGRPKQPNITQLVWEFSVSYDRLYHQIKGRQFFHKRKKPRSEPTCDYKQSTDPIPLYSNYERDNHLY